MADVISAKPKKVKQVLRKACTKCGKTKSVEDFYKNTDWEDQLGRDLWCKDCVSKCTNKDQIREYFWHNNREFNERIWSIAETRALKILTTNTTYQNATAERKKNILEKITCQQVPTSMQSLYKYVDNSKNGTILSYKEAKETGDIADESGEEEKVYSKDFNGFFFRHDLTYLEDYYNKLEEDFTFDNESIRDYARKVCKASLQADKVQDAYAAGKADFSSVKDALSQFDMLSKSANFAACSRKDKTTSDITSWSETSLYLETHGHPMERKIEWPKDTVDDMIVQLSHIAESLNIDG